MAKVKVCILRTAGTNCDREAFEAFQVAGAKPEMVQIIPLLENGLEAAKKHLKSYQILMLPGGFTYGDYISGGKILALELVTKLGDALQEFISNEKLVLGVCNGFQILVKAGLLPGLNGLAEKEEPPYLNKKLVYSSTASNIGAQEFQQQLSLVGNDSGKFEDRWINLKKCRRKFCAFTEGVDEIISIPIAHAEGKLVAKSESVLEQLQENDQIVWRYCSESGSTAGNGEIIADFPINPNGSIDNIAGVCDPSGRILGLMPHPERFIHRHQHPCWTRWNVHSGLNLSKDGQGLAVFKSAVNYFL